MTWQEAARGIPVWVHGRVQTHRHGGWRPYPCPVESIIGEHILVYTGEFPASKTVPDLEDPDTQAAYLRRLAIALGCPEDLAGECVGFILYGSWTVVAGCPDNDGAFPWSAVPPECARAIGKIEALALAWPADKRVTT